MANKSPTRKARAATGDELVLLALGGLGEVGMNAYLYGVGPPDGREWLLVDLGITFPEGENDPGVDVILPDIRFIEENRNSLSGIVITHAHEDHIGAVIDLWPRLKVPVYATPFTAGMLKAKLAEIGGKLDIPITIVPLGGRIKIGSFDVEFVNMSHSIPETSGLALRTRFGLIFHTADWKLDSAPFVGKPSDEAKLKALGEEGVLALVCDSTNAMRDGHSPSESEVAKSIETIIKGAQNRVIVTTFASNVARVRAVAQAARAAGRKLVVAGRALHRVIDVAIETGYLPQSFTYLDQQEFKYVDRSDLVCLSTGSQGEPRAAIARIAEMEHPDIAVTKGDVVIFSSRAIPGNEKAISAIQNSLIRIGCTVLTDNEALVHVTGHPRRDELRQMYAWLKPRIAVPMHGEARHLSANAALAREAGVAQVVIAFNGEIVRIAPGDARIVDDAPVGRLFRDGRLLIPDAEGPVRERRKLAMSGIATVSLVMSSRGELLAEPLFDLDGIPVEDADGESMDDIVLDAIEGTWKSIPAVRRRDAGMVQEAVRRAVRSAIANAWGKKPVTKVMLTVVEERG